MFDSMHFLTFKLYHKKPYVLKGKSSRLMVPNENKFEKDLISIEEIGMTKMIINNQTSLNDLLYS